MEKTKIVITGGVPLNGFIDVSGMKNAALPVLIASILTENVCTIENLPEIDDVKLVLEILSKMGAKIKTNWKNKSVQIDTKNIKCGSAPNDLVRKMRASYYIAGAELGRFGKTHVGFPGGCDFGGRPIEQHLNGFRALGANVESINGVIEGEAPNGLHGCDFFFEKNTVGGTINVMLAAVKANGTTIIEDAAKEPHIVDVANFLNTCGASISGAGTDTIKIKGVSKLYGCNYAIIPDMIEAGTYMIAAVSTKGSLEIRNVIPKHLESLSQKLRAAGAIINENDDSVSVKYNDSINSVSFKAMPYPGFPTDMQPQMCTLLCMANGRSVVRDGVYKSRFNYVSQLKKMGAEIYESDESVIVSGGSTLHGATVRAVDLRAGAAMVIAGLSADGETVIEDIYHIERGYDDIVGKLKSVGAKIEYK